MGAEAQIEEIDFPSTLEPGAPILGYVTIKNVGDEPGTLGVLITVDGVEHPLVSGGPTAPGGIMPFYYHAGTPAGNMPSSGSVQLKIEGRIWQGWDVGYKHDDIMYWSITGPGGEEPTNGEPTNGEDPTGMVTGPLGIWGYSRLGTYLNRFLPNIFREQ